MPDEEREYTLFETYSIISTWQGQVSYTLFSIYAVNSNVFRYYLGLDPGEFLFVNMLYGNAVHICTRPAMKKLRPWYRVCYCIFGSYCFNFASLILFFALGESYGARPLFVSILSYFVGKFMYSMFYTFFYFVDKLADPTSRSGESVFDFILAAAR